MLTITAKHLDDFRFVRGKYIITDPCYVFDDDTWYKLIAEVFYPDDGAVRSGVISIEGYSMWHGTTCYGNDTYEVKRKDKVVGMFGVDSGKYAIIPFEFFEKYSIDRELVKSGSAVSLIMSGVVVYNEGDMSCGDIEVKTS